MYTVNYTIKLFKLIMLLWIWLIEIMNITRMEMFGCNNLISHKVAARLKTPWICNVFYLVATL